MRIGMRLVAPEAFPHVVVWRDSMRATLTVHNANLQLTLQDSCSAPIDLCSPVEGRFRARGTCDQASVSNEKLRRQFTVVIRFSIDHLLATCGMVEPLGASRF